MLGSISVARIGAVVAFAGIASALTAAAQTAPAGGPPGPSPARVAIDTRKSAYFLIGANFRPLGAILKGGPYDADDVEKRVTRVAFLAGLLDDTFPAVSNLGEPDTKAKAEIWSNLPDFTKKLKDFQSHSAALVQVAATEKGPTDAFKAAVATVGQDCKGCHDTYRAQ
jgi:cytochrome c556